MTDKTIYEAPPSLEPGKRKILGRKKDLKNSESEFVKQFVPVLQKNCKQALSAFKKANVLYRGSKPHGSAYLGRSVKNRTPMDTPNPVQSNLDQLFLSAGYKAVRGNSIFVSGDADTADEYGHLYIIFPIDGFNFTWSTKISDLYSFLHHGGYETGSDLAQNSAKYIKINNSFVKALLKKSAEESIGHFHEYFLYDNNGFTGKKTTKIKISKMLDRWAQFHDSYFDELYIDDAYPILTELYRIKKYHSKQKIIAHSNIIKEASQLIKLDKKNNILDNEGRKQLSKIISNLISIFKMLKEYDKLINRILKELAKKPRPEIAAKALEKLGFMNNEHFVQAIESKNEIYINGLYYAFDQKRYGKIIHDWITGRNK